MTPAWQQRSEIGNDFWLRVIVRIAMSCGRSVARVLMWPATLYFFLRREPERRASRQYLERVLGHRVSAWQVYRHLHTFSCTVLDRLYLFSERFKRFDIRAHGLRELDRTLSGGKGVLLIGSHLGSFDALRVLSLERPEVMVRIVIDVEQNRKLSQFLECAQSRAGRQHHQRAPGRAGRGHRDQTGARRQRHRCAARGSRATQQCHGVREFSRATPAPFPHSPWLLASAVKSPVMLAFGLYGGGNRYDLLLREVRGQPQHRPQPTHRGAGGDSSAFRGPAGTLCAPGALQLVQLL